MKKHPHYGHVIKSRVSSALWQAIIERCQRTGETPDHVIQSALAAELDITHHTLFQVSTSTALVQGIYNGCMTVAEIKKHGDFGLGTFDELDGEGIMLNGEVWHAKSDGSLALAADNELAPFWATTNFVSQAAYTLGTVSNWADLCQQIDKLRESQNIFTSICIKGVFKNIQYRVACKAEQGTDLVSATNNQAVFELNDCSGTLVGFWTPEYAKTLNVPGYHLHLLSDDKRFGGHVLSLSAINLQLMLAEETDFKIALPESAEFLQADLSIDPSEALAKAEGAK
ncbi:MAG: Alpha-acetolactate decarboxylase [Pseudomonadota bacterium]|jgi:acetolactate decarboxylase|nr:Alpha-acetolactate decarboxylase [Pseudomonadota bacterium]